MDRLKRSSGNQAMTEQHHYTPNPDAFVYVKADGVMQKIFLNEMLYIESWKDYVRLYFTTGKYLLVKQQISAMESLLSEHQFLRVHRSYIINITKIDDIRENDLFIKGHEIPVSKAHKAEVLKRLNII